jgi:c-di-AMP phosphodiesterase-like protein
MVKEQQKVTTAKDLRKDIVLQLEKNLEPLKTILGEKKFKSRVKKAARILSDGITIKDKKEKATPKEPKEKKEAIKAVPVKNKPAVAKAAKKVKTPAPVKKETVVKAEA